MNGQRIVPAQIRNRAQVVNYSRLILTALEEVLDYNPAKHHNLPPPDLRLDNAEYLLELREIASLLRQLISLLSEKRPSTRKTSESVGILASYADAFLKNYIPVVGKGAGYLTVAAFGGLLYQAGLANEAVDELLKLARFAK